jgi:hypothetical protein
MGHSMILQQLRQFNVNQTYYGQSSNYMFESIVFQSDLAYRFVPIKLTVWKGRDTNQNS